MKKTNFLALITVVALIAFASCKPIDDPQQLTKGVTVTTAEPTYVSGTTAICGAEVTADDAGLLLELGVCWSKTEKPTVDDQISKTHKCSQPYQCFMMNLEPNTEYYVRGFAKYGTEYCYGDEKTFTTLSADVPSASPVTTIEATEITAQYFRSGVKVEPFGVSSYTPGICYSTQPDFTIEDCEGYEFGFDDENGVYPVYCQGLSPNTTYYYRAFVAWDEGNNPHINFFPNGYSYLYGEILSFTTPEVPFVLNLETYYPDFYGGNNWGRDIIAYGGGYCTNLQLIDQIGFCYSKDNEYPQYESDLFTIAATPTGDMHFEFSSYISNLSANTKYYIRSYARYMTDSVKYGNVVSFETY